MRDLSRKGYTHEEIKAMLHAVTGSREIRFRYDLLNKDEEKITTLDNVESGEVAMNAFNTIKRTAKFSLKEFGYQKQTYMTWDKFGPMEWSDLG